MTFPPPSHERPSSSSGGGFGPPPAYGTPPASPAVPPAGQQAAGGFGPAPAPFVPEADGPPPGGDGGGDAPRIAALFIGAVLVVGLGVGGLLIATRDGTATADTGRRPAPTAASPTDGAPDGAAGTETPSGRESASGGTPGPSEAPGGALPFVALKRGVCFDHPELDPTVREVVERPCARPHDGEVIGNRTLTGEFASDQELEAEALRLCGADVKQRMRDVPDDGRQYYNYALYPSLLTYQAKGENRVSCGLTLSDGPGGRKLTAALP